MNTVTEYTRVNLTIPKDIVAYLKRHTANMSSYISEAVRERIAREKRENRKTNLYRCEGWHNLCPGTALC